MSWTSVSRRFGAALPVSVFLLGLCITVGTSVWQREQTGRQAQLDFQRSVDRIADDISRRLRQPIYGLQGAAALYAANRRLDRATFGAYVAARDVERDFPGVRGFGFIQRVERDAIGAFVAAERADGAPQFAIRQLLDKSQADLYVIKYIQPAAPNQGAEGLDVGSERVRRAAAERAVRTGEPTLSGAITLVQDARRTPGFLLFVPLYRAGTDPVTPEQRRDALLGLFYAPIVAAEMLQGVAQAQAGLVEFELIDAPDPAAGGDAVGTMVYDSDVHDPTQALATAEARPGTATPHAAAHYRTTRVVALPGRDFTLQAHSMPHFDAAVPTGAALAVLVMGVLLSALLAVFVRQQQTGRQRAEKRARGMTADLARLALVAQRTSNAVIITDPELRITWVNEGFTRLYGHTVEQALGHTPGALLGHPDSAPQALETLREAAAAGNGCRVELVNRTRGGQTVYIDTEVQPTRDARGHLIGFVEIASDISARRLAEARMAGLMRDNEALLGTIRAHAIVSVARADGLIIDVNDAFCGISGYAREELLGNNHRIVNSGIQPPAFWAAMWSAITAGKPWRGQICNRAKDGSLYWVDSIIAPFLGADGRVEKYVSIRSDITASKFAERELSRQRQALANIVEGTGAGTWEWNLETGETVLNERWAEIVGETLTELGATTIDTWMDRTHPDDVEPVRKQIASHLRGATPVLECEARVRHKAGHWVWVMTRGKVVGRNAAGRPRWMAGTHLDISQHKQAEVARLALEADLRAKNELVSSVLESLPCGLSVFDAEFNLVVANAEFRRLLDLPDSLFDHGPARYDDIIRFNAERGEYGSEDVEAKVRALTERVRMPITPHRFERTRPDGTPLEIQGGPMPSGGFVTTYTDIGARKRAEAEGARSAALLRGAIDAIDEAFVLYDPDDRLVFCNDKYRQIYAGVAHLLVPGASFAEIVRRGAENGDYSGAVGRVDEWVAERLTAHQACDSSLMQRLRDGRTLRIVERKMPDGHIVGFRIDITELVQATEAAQAASQAKSRFLANMSHEIRTPMNAILGMLALLRKTDLSARQADYASKTEGAARSLLGLLNDILDFSKVEAGKMTLDPRPFRVDQLLRDLSVILSAGVGPKPVEVLFDIDPALPRQLVGDAMRLQQVLINLGGNAIKFTERGEVVLSMKVLARGAAGVTVEVAMRDSGIGIAPENHARIFSGFTQAEASTTRRFGGTGLGVAISQRLVALMGGELKLDSALGQGSRFHFCITLPVDAAVPRAIELPHDGGLAEASAPRLADKAAITSTSSNPASLRALLVDDNPVAREVLRRMAESLGWQVEMAESGAQALVLLRAWASAGISCHAVFIDWQMPGLDGWQTSLRIRELQLPGAAPVVLMVTAHGREMLAQRSAAETALFDGFLVKPVTASMLFDALVDARAGRNQVHASQVNTSAAASPKRLAGMRLLVAEDNLNNQQVARELLEDEGALVQIANDGAQAVAAVAAADPPFDAVLMDLQMPVLDGFSATVRIRQDPGQQRLPIVAMTANAMASDREACLAAGMNDHIGKPFDLDHLVNVLCKHTGRGGQAAGVSRRVAAALPAGVAAAAAAAGVQIDAAMARLGGKRDTYAQMLRRFLDDLSGAPAQLQGCAAQGDMAALARLLHTVKGVAATLGAADLAAEAARGERQLVATRTSADAAQAIASACTAIRASAAGLQALLQALQQDLQARAAANTADRPFDPKALQQDLRHLAELLRQSDMAAVDAMAGLPRPAAGALNARFQALNELIAALDFEPALRHCETLIEVLEP